MPSLVYNPEMVKTPLSSLLISKTALLHNISLFKSLMPKGVKLIHVVKANAYGHGLREIVSISKNLVDAFQVDDIEELRVLRKVTKKPCFVFGFVQKRDLEELVRLDGVLGCYNLETIKELGRIAKKNKKQVSIHLKIDAFLGRQGVFIEDLPPILSYLKSNPLLSLISIHSHFSNIEDVEDLIHAKKQSSYLFDAKSIIEKAGFNVSHHISATSGFLSDIKENWGGEYVRLGIGSYGLWPSLSMKKKLSKKIDLRPVLTWVTKVGQIKTVPKNFPIGYGLSFVTKKTMQIALIPQGYSDGYDRKLSNNSFVIIKGKKCPLLGRVAMNMFVVDVTGKNVHLEDEVILLGKEISADYIAEKIGTINYEVVARINPLLPKVIVA
jgi:alanine racemase